ncbi:MULTISPECIES: hypothetical protein, partial [unclassified Bradyrhizobium]|uniref:hypothetical protein n=1 Tax=unclassified Bradyrhizobium TaxID=2631580 RepID=UPI001FF8EB66
LAFHGIYTSRRTKAESVTRLSGTKCHLCLGPLTTAWTFHSDTSRFIDDDRRLSRAFGKTATRGQ